MGLFDSLLRLSKAAAEKTKNLAEEKLQEVKDGSLVNRLTEAAQKKAEELEASITKKVENKEAEIEEVEEYEEEYEEIEELDEEEYDEDDEDDEEEDEDEDDEYEEDEELSQLEEQVDQMLSSGEENEALYAALMENAARIGIANAQFQQMCEARMALMQEELDDMEREVRRARRKWRRCPSCHSLVYVEDVYCDWCGYQLRHHPLTTAAALAIAAGSSNSSASKKAAKRVKPTKTAKTVAKRKVEAPVKKTTPAPAPKKGLFGSKPAATAEPKKSLFGSAPAASKSEPKKSLFGGNSGKTSLLSHKNDAPKKSSSLLSHSSSSTKKSGGLLGGGSSSKKSGGLLGGGSSSRKSGGSLLGGAMRAAAKGGGRRRR